MKKNKIEEIVLDEGFMETVKGFKITLSDGRVFIPKLVEKFTSDGNYGRNTYEYVLESETPEVKYVDGSEDVNKEGKQDYIEATQDPSFNCGNCDKCNGREYGLTDEADPESDGELEGEPENDGG